jgi:hypothetical protein
MEAKYLEACENDAAAARLQHLEAEVDRLREKLPASPDTNITEDGPR